MDAPTSVLVRRASDPRLAPHVLGYTGFTERAAAPLRRTEVPVAMVPVIVAFGDPYRVIDPRRPAEASAHPSFVAGLGDSYVVTELAGAARGVQVNLTPLGAWRLGLPMGELANRVVALEDLFGAAAPRLVARLAEATSWEACFPLVEAFLAARLDAGREPSPGVVWAWRRLEETRGRVAIGALTAELGWSRKHLAARFREQIGLPPKVVARILRFQRALRLLDRRPPLDWTDLALRCGYYDQAHLIRDVRQFAGSTPGELLRARQVTSVQDTQASAA